MANCRSTCPLFNTKSFPLTPCTKEPNSLSRLMQWVMTSHVRYYHKKNKTSGHIWQGRYKRFIVEKESYCLESLLNSTLFY